MKMKKGLLFTVMILSTLVFGFAQSSSPRPLTVEIFDREVYGGRTPADNNAWTDWIKQEVLRELNIDITFVPVSRWNETRDIVNMMSFATAPDLCYTYNRDLMSLFRGRRSFLDLAPFIDSHLPDLKRLLGEDPALPGREFIYRNADPQTGSIYSISGYSVSLAQRNIFIRKDWLDKLGLPLPTNIQEFYNALVAFRDLDPGGVGKNMVVPFGQNSDARWGLANLIHNFINPNLSDRDRWVNYVYERYLMMPGYKEGVRLMNQWYNERLIYQNFTRMTSFDNFHNLLKSGVVGAFCQNWDVPYRTDYRINEELAMNIPGAEFVPIDIVQNKDMMDKATGLQIFIPSFSKNHIAALEYLNWLAKPENYHFLQVGQEGVNHQLRDGVPNIIARPPGDPWYQNSAQNVDYTMPMNGVEMGNPELNARVLAFNYSNTPPDIIVKAYMISTRNARAAPVYQAVTTVNQYAPILQDKADQLLAQAITGDPRDFDRIWDAGIQDWLASGGQEVLNERASLYPP